MSQASALTVTLGHTRSPRAPGRPPAALPQLGYSGCSVRLGSWGPVRCVEKRATGPYATRLDNQMTRQEQARQANTLPFVRIPKLYDRQWTLDGAFVARMEYLLFLDCLRSFATASRPQIDHTVRMLIAYVEANIAASALREVPLARLRDKLEQIEAALARTDQLPRYGRLIDAVRRRLPARPLVLPLGPTHGDLTLSNVMISSDVSALGLLDFLDGYLDSPLVDVAKLRQDTRFHWSLRIAEGPVDRPRLASILRYMDRLVLAHFQRYEWVRLHLDLIQAINLLRIAPYAATTGNAPAMHEFLLDAITSLGF